MYAGRIGVVLVVVGAVIPASDNLIAIVTIANRGDPIAPVRRIGLLVWLIAQDSSGEFDAQFLSCT